VGSVAVAGPATQPRLISLPMAGAYPIDLDEANRMLTAWGHRLGPVNRPFRSEAWSLDVGERAVAVAVTCSTVSSTVAGYRLGEVVELARLCAEPGNTWANRVLLRLWREVLAPAWALWPVRAAVSYSHNAMHRGDIYRTDGWERVRTDAGFSGKEAWGRPGYAMGATAGSKTLWLWRYDREVANGG